MKRTYTREETVAVEVFLAQATDVLQQLVWAPEQSLARPEWVDKKTGAHVDQRRDAIRALRSLLSVNRATYRLLLTHQELWQQLLHRLLPQQGVRLSTSRLEAMSCADLLQLYRGALYGEYFWRAQCATVLNEALASLVDDDAELRRLLPRNSPLVLIENVVDIVGIAFRVLTGSEYGRAPDWDGAMRVGVHIDYEEERWSHAAVVQLYSAAEPLSWLLAMALRMVEADQTLPRLTRQDFDGSVRARFQRYTQAWISTATTQTLYMAPDVCLAPLRRLVTLWGENETVRVTAHARLAGRLRGELQWGALATQQEDTPDALVPLDELPLSYCLFWWALQRTGLYYSKSAEIESYRHKMFHAPVPQCHQCTAPLAGVACWERTRPHVLYCDAECFTAAQ